MQETKQPVQTAVQNQLTFHTPLVWISLAFLLGIVLASLLSLPLWLWGGIGALFMVLAIVVRVLGARLPQISLPPALFSSVSFGFILIAFLFFGSARYQYSTPNFDAFHIASFNDRDYDLLITGYLIEPPDYRDTYTNLRLQVTNVDTGDANLPADGLLLARVSNNQIFEYGQVVRLRGTLKTPPENDDFSYRDYLAAQGIHAYMSNAIVTTLPGNRGNPIIANLYAFKQRSLQNIYRLFPDPEASLLAGILLGVDTGLTKELQQAFKDTGTAHVIAISGFNISIIAGIFLALFSKLFGNRYGALIAVAGIVLYTFIVGAEAAVVRAAIMGIFVIFAKQVGRGQVALNTLLFVAMLMCLWNPLYLWDVGFQLSFFATLGLVLYATPFSEFANTYIAKLLPASITEKVAQLLSEFVLITFAAQITTIPIMAYHFQRISLISFIANPFILPAQPALMILGGLAVLLSHVSLGIGQLLAWVTYPFAAYTIRMVELFDSLPHGVLTLGDFSLVIVILFYITLLSVTFGWSTFKEQIRSLGQRASLVGVGSGVVALGIALFLVSRAATAIPDQRLHLTFLDVGSADSVLIKTPAGKFVLVNGGESVTNLSDQLGRQLPAFNRQLSWLVIASTKEEQVAALPRTLERYPPSAVLWSGNPEGSFSSRALDEYITAQTIPLTMAEPGQILDLGDGATLTVVASGTRGAVLLVEWQNFRALLPIGMSFEALAELQNGASIGQVSVLSLADAGYAPSNPPEWIANLNPELIVLNVAAGDENGLPDGEVLETVKEYSLLRTDQNGWVEISTDGISMWVNAESNPQPEGE